MICKNSFHLTAPWLLAVVLLSLSVLADDAPVLPPGTTIKVRMIDKLSSEESQVGDTFHATLEEPIAVNGKTLYPKGADVLGRVADVHASGRLSEPGELDLVLATVSSGRTATSLSVQPLVIKGESHTKSNATKIGGGAALGAIIGAVAGGGKGAAIGTAAGAAAGTGAAAATGKKAVKVESEAVLTFVTTLASTETTSVSAPIEDATQKVEAPVASAPAEVTSPPAQSAPDLFTLRDRRILRNCLRAHADDLAQGATERPEKPAESEQGANDEAAPPPDVQRQAQPLPLACEEQLPKLPVDMERVIYRGRVLLLDGRGHVLDTFYLDDNQ
jgi:hypothetical protein